MQRSDGECGSDTTRERSFPVDRRSYLKLAGVAAGSVPLLSGAASAGFERRGIRFENTVDMVRDAGCDPTGEEACNAQIEDAAADSTLLKFPAGEYKITENLVIFDKTNLGFVGEGDVRFTVPENFHDKVLTVDRGTGLLFENIDIDQRADGATPALHLAADDDLRVHDVELIGQGIHPDSIPKGQPGWKPESGSDAGNPSVPSFFYPIVRSESGTGLITELDANNHGLMATYNAGNGRGGVWVGTANTGTVTFRDCRVEEFGANGCYASRTYGVVRFEGGVYRNNDVCQVRVGAPGSSVEGAILDVDADSSSSPNPYEALNYRGVRIETGRHNSRTEVTIRDCDIAIRSSPHTGGGVLAERTASEFLVENTRIGVDVDNTRAVLAKEPTGGGHYPPPDEPHAVTLRGVSMTGTASGTEAVKIQHRPNSVVEGCCIQGSGSDRDGVEFVDSDGSVVRNSTVDVTGQQVVEGGGRVSTSNLSTGESCPTPKYGAGDSLPRKLTFESNGGRFSYTFSVSGDLGKSTARTASLNSSDTVSGNTATGQGGGGGIDSYGFSGDILAFDVTGDVTVYLDDEVVDPSQFPDNTLSFASNGGQYSYAFAVSGDLEKSTAMGASIDSNDIASGSMATGQGGGGGTDSYTFSGGIVALELNGAAEVLRNGERIDPGRYPDPHTLTIEGTGSRATYDFSVSGDLTKSAANGASINGNDNVAGSGASGVVGIGSDSYAFLGDLSTFGLDGDADVFLDGERIHPNRYPDHVLTIKGTGSRATYDFSVSGDIAKSTANGANLNDNDRIKGSGASGVVGAATDSYDFSGSLNSISLDGDADVFLDGERIHPNRYPDHVLTIEGTGSRATYDFSVSGDLAKSTANGANLNGNDHVRGSGASGVVGAATDSYDFLGDLNSISVNGDANVFLDGRRIDPDRYPDHVLTIEGTGSRATYDFSVSGNLAKSTANGANLNSNDHIRGSSASGVVGAATDSYAFSGGLNSISLDGDANVFLDGRRIDTSQ